MMGQTSGGLLPPRRVMAVAGLLLTAISLAACGTRSSANSAASPHNITASVGNSPGPSKHLVSGRRFSPFAPPDSGGMVAYAPGLTTWPLKSKSVGPVTAGAARADAIRGGAVDEQGTQTGVPQAAARIVSVGFQGQSGFAPHPAWVLTWSNQKAVIYGSMTLSTSERKKLLKTEDCTYVLIIDGATGKVQGGTYQFCQPRGTR